MNERLSHQQKHAIKLIARGRNSDGWAKVSATLYDCLFNSLPKELVEFKQEGDGSGFASFTEAGEKVLFSMNFL